LLIVLQLKLKQLLRRLSQGRILYLPIIIGHTKEKGNGQIKIAFVGTTSVDTKPVLDWGRGISKKTSIWGDATYSNFVNLDKYLDKLRR